LLTLCNEEGRKKEEEEENDAMSCRRSVSAATACFCYHPLKFAGHQRFRVVLAKYAALGVMPSVAFDILVPQLCTTLALLFVCVFF